MVATGGFVATANVYIFPFQLPPVSMLERCIQRPRRACARPGGAAPRRVGVLRSVVAAWSAAACICECTWVPELVTDPVGDSELATNPVGRFKLVTSRFASSNAFVFPRWSRNAYRTDGEFGTATGGVERHRIVTDPVC